MQSPSGARPPQRRTWGRTLSPSQLTKPGAWSYRSKLASGAGGELVVVTAEVPNEPARVCLRLGYAPYPERLQQRPKKMAA